jgi:methionyl-tRNA formyltransferase
VAEDQPRNPADAWRVVVFTNLPGGIIYHAVDAVLRPLGHRIVGLVTSPGPKRRRSDSYLDVVKAAPPGVDVIVTNHPQRLAAMLAPLQPDLIICGGFPWRIPTDVIQLPRLGAINFHPSHLPRHRGPNAVGWAFRADDPEIGFTVHRLDADFDTGAILAQTRIPITDDDNGDSLNAKIGAQIAPLLGDALWRVAQAEPGEAQDETQASYAGLFEDDWRVIDWTRRARAIHNQVRSWVGFRDIPAGAFGQVGDETLLITKTRLLSRRSSPESVSVPGTILSRDGDSLVVQCGDEALAIVTWTRAMGNGITAGSHPDKVNYAK